MSAGKKAYYNEVDPFCCAWIRNLIDAGFITPGDVDERSVAGVSPDDLIGYGRCHFFAGIALWDYALSLAGWPEDCPVWSGSCPCQPFSGAGKGLGFADPRHLWPVWHGLIRERRPERVVGEQVDSPDARLWLDLVSADLEACGYAVGSVVLPSAGVGAPNIRHRRYWVADTEGRGRGEHGIFGEAAGSRQDTRQPVLGVEAGRLGHAGGAGLPDAEPHDLCGAGRRPEGRAASEPSGPRDPWRELEWIACRDGRLRPTEPGLFPLAPRRSGDVGKLRAYGNAINPVLAAEVIKAWMDVAP